MLSKAKQKEFLRLLDRYRQDRATPEETRFVEKYSAWFDNQPPLSEQLSPAEQDHLEQRLLQQLHARINGGEETRVVPFYRRPWVSVAAAIILLAGCLLTWRLITVSSRPAPVIAGIPADLPPGRTGAVLTLSGGQKLLLDSSAKGILAAQGNATVTNSPGTLTYAKSEEKAGAIVYNTLSTSRGNQYQLVLPDGSKVWLDAASSITYPTAFSSATRTVRITGEAYFEVAKNPARPFIVQVGEATVQVLGTHFNVMAYPNESSVQTTLLEGAVEFHNGGKTTRLKPGQQSQLYPGGQTRLVQDADVDQAVAWKNGVQSFSGADVKAIMRSVERWYDVEVDYAGALPAGTFSGDIPRGANLSAVLKLFEASQIHFNLDPTKKKLTVLP